MTYRSSTPRLPVINEEPPVARSISHVSPIIHNTPTRIVRPWAPYARSDINEELERSSSPVVSAPIVIPPIIIPDSPTQHVRPYAPYARPVMHTVTVEPVYVPPPIVQEEPPSHILSHAQRIPSCMCGYTKIVVGFVVCPIVCSASCIAGTTYTICQAIQCNPPTNDTLKYRDTFCTYYGCGTAYTTSYRIIESGLRDIRVQQNMSR